MSPLEAVAPAVYFNGAVPLFLMTKMPAVELPGIIVRRLSVVYAGMLSQVLT